MKATKTIQIALGAAFAVLLTVGPAHAIEFNDKQLDKLKAGKSVKKPLAGAGTSGVYGGSGFALVDAPPEVVWEAILDWGAYRKIFPKTLGAREISRKGGRSLVRMDLGHKLIGVSFFLEVETNERQWQVSYKLVENKPHDVEEVRGYWRLFPQQNGQTLVAYVTAVKLPMGVVNLIPEQLEKKINRNLLASPQYLRTWIHGPGNARYCRADD
jgi:ribosome-associated toxin RatA of RatAB toxin-antitoxin module